MGIEELSSVDGIIWRRDYEDGTINQLDTKVWLPAFKKLERLNMSNILDQDTMYSDDLLCYDKFMDGTQAMVNISSESFSKSFPARTWKSSPTLAGSRTSC